MYETPRALKSWWTHTWSSSRSISFTSLRFFEARATFFVTHVM